MVSASGCTVIDSSTWHLGVTAQHAQSSNWFLPLTPLVWKRVIDSQAEKLKELDKEIRPFRQNWEEADSMKSSVESLQNRVTELESVDKSAGQAARNTGEVTGSEVAVPTCHGTAASGSGVSGAAHAALRHWCCVLRVLQQRQVFT